MVFGNVGDATRLELEIPKNVKEWLGKTKIEVVPMLEDFVKKFKKSGKAKDDLDALELMQRIFDAIEGDLDRTENRAATAVITYLKAKKQI